MSLFGGALRRVSFKLPALQLGLGIVVFLLAIVWLRLPDSSVLWVTVSFVLGLLTLAVAGAGQSWIALWLVKEPCTRKRLLYGSIAVIVSIGLWLWITHRIESLQVQDFQRASYLNSQMPHSLRYFFTFERISSLLAWLWSALGWIVAGLLAIASFAVIVGSVRGAVRSLRSITWWVALLLLTWLAEAGTTRMMSWVPGRGLKTEAFSLVARLVFVVLFNTAIVSFLLALLAQLQAMPAGTPEASQPRTEDNP